MFRNSLVLIQAILTVLFSCLNSSSAAENPISILLAKIEDDSSSLPFHEHVQMGLELINYYKTLGEPKHVLKIYDGLFSAALDAPVAEIHQDGSDFVRLNQRMMDSGYPSTVKAASAMRENVIRRTLDSPDESVQNNYFNVGGPAISTLGQLARSPEFPDLLRLAISSFPLDRAEIQTRARAVRLTQLVSNNYAGYMDARLQSEAALREHLKRLGELDSKSDLTKEEVQEKKSLKELISYNQKFINQRKIEDPCWIDPRVKLDDSLLQNFTCADASIFAHGDLSSADDFNFLQMLYCASPFTHYIGSCNIDFQVRQRTIAVRDAKLKLIESQIAHSDLLKKCEIPSELHSNVVYTGEVDLNKKEKLEKIQPSDRFDCNDFSVDPDQQVSVIQFSDCDQVLDFLKDEKQQQKVTDERFGCEKPGENASCYDQASADAMKIRSDSTAVTAQSAILESEMKSKKTELPRVALMNLSARLSHLANDQLAYFNFSLEKDLLTYLSNAWKTKDPEVKATAFDDVTRVAQVVGDTGLRDHLSLLIIERFTELDSGKRLFRNQGMGSSFEF